MMACQAWRRAQTRPVSQHAKIGLREDEKALRGFKKMKHLSVADAIRYPTMTTEELRAAFVLSDLFQPGSLDLTYVDLDRTIVGSAVPAAAPLTLPNDETLRAAFFLERRELGVLNIGAAGIVTVDGERFALSNL